VETALAIYEALIQANVPPPAARRVAEALEKDMSSNLATKQDLRHLEHLMETRFEAADSRLLLLLQNQESRIVIKLGALMTILFGVASAVVAVLR